MSGYFIYNGVKSLDLGIYVRGDSTYVMPSPNIKRTNIPNRNGDLLDTYGNYPNVNVVYHCSAEAQDINTVLADIANAWLSVVRYARLTDTYHPNIYRLGFITSTLNPDAYKPNNGLPHRVINFDITFNCKPQKYLLSGEEEITLSGTSTINNPTSFKSSPLLKLTGTGSIIINQQQIQVLENVGEITVDCETMDAYSNGTSYNSIVHMPLDDVVLVPGNNDISVSGLTAKMMPRWWRL